MTKISEELKTRIIKKEVHDDKYGIIGVEIKNRRQITSQTLEALSSDVCSLSYLCKIEKNSIAPNKAFLREICSRLDLSDEKVDYLFELRDALINSIHAFLINDKDIIELAYEHGVGFQNYRFSIIELIHLIFIKDIDNAYKKCVDLLPLISNMSDFDLTIYAVFSSIVYYHRGEYANAFDDLALVDKFYISTDLRIIKDMYLFRLSFCMNKPDTLRFYETVNSELYLNGYYNLIDENKYIIGLFYIKNECDKSYKDTLLKIENRILKKSLEGIYEYFNDNSDFLLNAKDNELNDYARCLKHIIVGDSLKLSEKYDRGYYNYDFDIVMIKYLENKTPRERMEYIFKQGLPMAVGLNDGYLKAFFINEIAHLPVHISKNRAILRAYNMAYFGKFNYSEFEEMENESEESDQCD